MAIPRFVKFFLPALQVGAKEVKNTKAATVEVAKLMRLSDEDLAENLRTGMSRVYDRVQWAVTYMNQAGLVKRPSRGHYVATEEGRKLLATNPDEITLHMLRQYAPFREFMERARTQSEEPGMPTEQAESETPEENMEASIHEANKVLKSELLERIRSMEPVALEKLIIKLMLAMGYGGRGSAERVGRSADGGIDGVINEDELGLDIIYLQAKRYAADNVIGVERIREFAGALDEKGATKGVFVTTSRFAAPAERYAQNSPKRLILIDGDRLATLMIDKGVAVRTYRTFEFKKLDEDYFEDLGA